MLLVNARAGVSRIHGIGLIAREFIPRGASIWEYRPGFDLELPDDLVRILSGPAQEQVFWYAYYDLTQRVYVLSADDDRFTNHADDPNTTNEGKAVTFATRDILPGEEITWDYRPWGGLLADEKAAFVGGSPLILPHR
ncbi:MAG: SET domain-containing protein [Gemmataceae bacterium]